MADDGWISEPAPVASPATPPASQSDDGWVSAKPAEPSAPFSGQPDGWSGAALPLVQQSTVGKIMDAFGTGFSEAWGPAKLGLSNDSVKWLSQKGVFAPEGQAHYSNPFHAFNEGIMVPAATALDAAIRLPGALYHGAQEAGMAAGLHRDIVSLPDAFLGSPGALGHVEMRPGLPDHVADIIEETPKSAEAVPKPAGLKLVEAPEGGVYTPDQIMTARGEKYFKAVDADGNVAAEMLIKIDGKSARIEDILNPSAPREEGIGSLGIPQLRDLLGQFREQFPDVTELTGNRVSGAREGGKYELGAKNEIAIALPQAKDLGIIGPEKPAIADAASPKEAAEAAVPKTMAAEGPKGEKVTQEVGGAPDPWQQRFDQFVSKLQAPDDVKDLIRQSAKENGDFLPARQGNIPLGQVEDIATAAGVDPSEVNARGLGRRLQNDGEVRSAMQLMLKTTDDVKAAARDVKAGGDETSLAKLQEAIMRRDLAVEQVVGLRAEWGRTGNVIQEFMTKSREENGLSDFLKDKGRTPDDLRAIADSLDALDGPQSARFLNDLRTPSAWDKFKWYWVNSLISGPVTHAKYVVANAAFAGYEAAVVTPVAGMVGTARRALTGGDEGVYMGEAAARAWGIVAGVPDAVKAAVQAAKTGMQTPLPGEIAQNIIPKQNRNVTFQQRPIKGPLGAVIGVPSRGASAIHSFFNFMGYRAGIEAQAYRQAVKEGLTPAAAPQPIGLPPVAPGFIRFFHGGDNPGAGGGRWVNQSQTYATNYRPGQSVHYVDIPHSWLDQRFPDTDLYRPSDGSRGQSYPSFEAPEQFAKQMKPVDQGSAASTSTESFWQRRQRLADNPTAEMMNSAIEDGNRLTYITELGETGRKLSAFVNSTKVGQLIMPFTHIPLNILKRAVEGTPAAFLDAETRDALTGKAGAVKQDQAIARMVAGSAVGAWAVNQVLNERMTGFGPTDQKERAQWMATGHQPYSIRIGNEWVSFNRFGSLGTMLGLYANLAEVIPHMKPDNEELTKGIALAVHSTGRLMEDEVGMQGLAGLMDAINEPDRKGPRFVANFAGSLLPFSSAQRQVASAMDPSMREAKTVVDGLRYYIPGLRQGLLPKRDWAGLPVANAGYGGDIEGAPGLSAVIQHRNAVADPVAQEFTALDLHPAPPTDRVKGVKLPPKLYDTYQSTAGALTRTALESLVNQPGWHDIPIGVRAQVFRSFIQASRNQAGTAMQMRYPQLIQQGVQERLSRINGVKAAKLKDPD